MFKISDEMIGKLFSHTVFTMASLFWGIGITCLMVRDAMIAKDQSLTIELLNSMGLHYIALAIGSIVMLPVTKFITSKLDVRAAQK